MKIVDGPSSIDLTSKTKDLKSLLDSLIDQYNKMKMDYAISVSSGVAFAVSTPINANLGYNKRFT